MRNKRTGAVMSIGLALVMSAVALVQHSGAQGFGETTILTFSRAVELPTGPLAAGTYIFELVSPMSTSGVVRVTSRDGHSQYFMGFTHRVDRPRGMNDASVTLSEAAAGVAPRIQAGTRLATTAGISSFTPDGSGSPSPYATAGRCPAVACLMTSTTWLASSL